MLTIGEKRKRPFSLDNIFDLTVPENYAYKNLVEGKTEQLGINRTKNKQQMKTNDEKINNSILVQHLEGIKRQEHSQINIVKKSNLEIYKGYYDSFIFLNFRRSVMVKFAKLQEMVFAFVTDKKFETLSLFVIIMNTLLMMFDDPRQVAGSLLDKMDSIFLLFYSVELSLKIFAFGIWERKTAFFRDSWNNLDFFIVTTSILDFTLSGLVNINLSSLRSLRVLRPLRTISTIRKLKNLVQTIFAVLPLLLDVLLITFFTLFIFAIAGLHLYMGALNSKCTNDLTGNFIYYTLSDNDQYCTDSTVCPSGYSCVPQPNSLGHNANNFDNIMMSFLQTFLALTMNGWFQTQYSLINAFSEIMAGITVVYYSLIILIGNYLFLNLVTAVIVMKFMEVQTKNILKTKEVVHTPGCLCGEGLDFAQLKACGYFTELSHLKRHQPKRGNNSKKQCMSIFNKKSLELKIDLDYNFIILNQDPITSKKTILGNKDKMMRKLIQKTRLTALSQTQKMEALASNLMQSQISPIGDIEKEGVVGISQQNKKYDIIEEESDDSDERSEQMGYDDIKIEYNDQEQVGGVQQTTLPMTINFSQRGAAIQEGQQTKYLEQAIVHSHEEIKSQSDLDAQTEVSMDDDFEPKQKGNLLQAEEQILSTHFIEQRRSRQQERLQHNEDIYMRAMSRKKNNTALKMQRSNDNIAAMNNKIAQRQLQQEQLDNFVSQKPNLFKLDYNNCVSIKSGVREETVNNIMPSIQVKKRMGEIFKKQQIRREKTQLMVYKEHQPVKQKKEAMGLQSQQKSSSATIHSSQLSPRSYANHVLRNNTTNFQQLFNGTIFSKDLTSSQSFYCYLAKDIESIAFDEPTYKCVRKVSQGQKEQTIKPKESKSYFKNFYTIKNYFLEEFKENMGERKEGGSVLSMEAFYESLIDNDLLKLQINHTNWSGGDIIEHYIDLKYEKISHQLNLENWTLWIPGFAGFQYQVRTFLVHQFDAQYMQTFFIFLVLLNTLILSLTGLVSAEQEVTLEFLNNLLTWVFLAEMVLKIYGYGYTNYVKDGFNVFDAVIVIISLIDIILGSNTKAVSVIKVVRVIRILRVLRVTRLLRSMKFMKTLMQVIMSTIEDFAYMLLLFFIFMIIFALIGMQLFSGYFNFYEASEQKYENFDDFKNALLTVFQIMTLSDWDRVVTLVFRSGVNPFIGLIYLFIWIFIGNFILLNILMAILIDAFKESQKEQSEEIQDEYLAILHRLEGQQRQENQNSQRTKETEKEQKEPDQVRYEIREALLSKFDGHSYLFKEPEEENRRLEGREEETQEAYEPNDEQIMMEYILRGDTKRVQKADIGEQGLVCGMSLYLFSRDNRFRILIARLVKSNYFENTIIVFILLSSLSLAISTYSKSFNDQIIKLFDFLDIFFTLIFLLESILKIIALGFFICPESYLRDNWSRLDFFIVTVSTLELSLSSLNLPFLRIFRILRTLRPLRLMSHNENLRVVVSCLLESFGAIANVTLVIFVMWLIYGILGINLMAGRFGYCHFEDSRSYYNINETVCPHVGGNWSVFQWNFDNIINAMVMLFIQTTQENWNEFMNWAMDSAGADTGPSNFGTWFASLYYVVFIFLSAFFMFNLFVAVIFNKFFEEQNKDRQKHYKMITDEQIKWIQMQKLIQKTKPDFSNVFKPSSKWRLFIYNIIQHPSFDLSIMSIIILNIFSMSVEYYGQSELQKSIIDMINYFFTTIFIIEAILKIVGLGKVYFKIGWNQFDFAIVLSSIFDIIMINFINLKSLRIYPQLARVLKILRVTRLLKIMKSKSLRRFQRVLQTLVFAMPAIINVFVLMGIILFLYAIMGVFLFQDDSLGYFPNFGVAMLLLFRFLSGEGWPNSMYDIISNGNSPVYTSFYFLTFVFFTYFVIAQLFIAVVSSQFDELYFNPDNPLDTFEEIADKFRKCWIKFTLKHQGFKIDSNEVCDFFICLQAPLGFFIPNKREKRDVYGDNFDLQYFKDRLYFQETYVRKKVADMQLIDDENGFVSFGQVLFAAMRNAFGIRGAEQMTEEAQKFMKEVEFRTIAKIFKKSHPNETSEQNDNKQEFKLHFNNPFTRLLFTQLCFDLWFNYTKKELQLDSSQSIDLKDTLKYNPKFHFEKALAQKLQKNVKK